MFDISTQFSEDWHELLCLQGKVFCLKYETFFQRKSMLISTCRYLSLAVNYVFVDKNRTACGEQNSSKGSSIISGRSMGVPSHIVAQYTHNDYIMCSMAKYIKAFRRFLFCQSKFMNHGPIIILPGPTTKRSIEGLVLYH